MALSLLFKIGLTVAILLPGVAGVAGVYEIAWLLDLLTLVAGGALVGMLVYALVLIWE